MSDPVKPVSFIKPQVLTTSPIIVTTTLVDDPVVLVDGSSLTGSQTTPIATLRVNASGNAPSASIKRRS